MNHVAIVSACRTPIGTIGGQFKTLTALDLSIPVMQALIQRSGVDPALIDDVIWAATTSAPTGEQPGPRGRHQGRLPDTVPGITVHRNCTPPCPPFSWASIRSWPGRPSALWPAVRLHERRPLYGV